MTHAIVWLIYSPESDMGRLLGCEQEFSLPHLVYGAAQRDLEQGREVRIDAYSLCLGILVAEPSSMRYGPPSPSHDRLRLAIRWVADTLGFRSPDALVAHAAGELRGTRGLPLAASALRRGLILLEEPHLSRCELVEVLWELARRQPDEAGGHLAEIVDIFEHLSLMDVARTRSGEMLLYAYLAALTYLGQSRHLQRALTSIAPLVGSMPWLRAQLGDLDSISPADPRVLSPSPR